MAPLYLKPCFVAENIPGSPLIQISFKKSTILSHRSIYFFSKGAHQVFINSSSNSNTKIDISTIFSIIPFFDRNQEKKYRIKKQKITIAGFFKIALQKEFFLFTIAEYFTSLEPSMVVLLAKRFSFFRSSLQADQPSTLDNKIKDGEKPKDQGISELLKKGSKSFINIFKNSSSSSKGHKDSIKPPRSSSKNKNRADFIDFLNTGDTQVNGFDSDSSNFLNSRNEVKGARNTRSPYEAYSVDNGRFLSKNDIPSTFEPPKKFGNTKNRTLHQFSSFESSYTSPKAQPNRKFFHSIKEEQCKAYCGSSEDDYCDVDFKILDLVPSSSCLNSSLELQSEIRKRTTVGIADYRPLVSNTRNKNVIINNRYNLTSTEPNFIRKTSLGVSTVCLRTQSRNSLKNGIDSGHRNVPANFSFPRKLNNFLNIKAPTFFLTNSEASKTDSENSSITLANSDDEGSQGTNAEIEVMQLRFLSLLNMEKMARINSTHLFQTVLLKNFDKAIREEFEKRF